ncbi:MAG: hypothetical protein VKK59_05060 [Vampirovibrionales bacterium]|nr:hypothetical protein [Vampirovibrionales bacterium]
MSPMQIRPTVQAAPRFGSSAPPPSGASEDQSQPQKSDINPEYVLLRDWFASKRKPTGNSSADTKFTTRDDRGSRTVGILPEGKISVTEEFIKQAVPGSNAGNRFKSSATPNNNPFIHTKTTAIISSNPSIPKSIKSETNIVE